MLKHKDTYGQAQVCSKGHPGSSEARGKRRVFSPAAAARHSQSARDRRDFPKNTCFSQKKRKDASPPPPKKKLHLLIRGAACLLQNKQLCRLPPDIGPEVWWQPAQLLFCAPPPSRSFCLSPAATVSPRFMSWACRTAHRQSGPNLNFQENGRKMRGQKIND